jgi:hypothetical protein
MYMYIYISNKITNGMDRGGFFHTEDSFYGGGLDGGWVFPPGVHRQ